MKILWVVNLILPAYAEARGLPFSEREGWLSGMYDAVRERRDIELAVAYPLPPGAALPAREQWDGAVWYGFREDLAHPERYDEAMEAAFRQILDDSRPDIVHVFGTEFPHALAALKVFDRPERALVGIQGVCTSIADCYMAGLPEKVQRTATLRDLIRDDSLRRQQEKFRKRADNEQAALQHAGHVTGRTRFDRDAVGKLSPDCTYHAMNENLRSCFYEGAWERTKAVPHRIFLPQGDYPLKGFHYLLQALPLLTDEFPDAEIAVAGNSVVGEDGRRIPLFLRIGAYGRYLRMLITQTQARVTLLGRLSAQRMKEEMLLSGVLVLPSQLENSPNSMGEAMLLGMPVVASDTGGIPSLLSDGKEGLLVAPGDTEGLARAIRQIWNEPMVSDIYAENARKRALATHDRGANLARLFAIYEEILTGGEDPR